jgi:iron complex outermembrane receptor protein
VSFPLDDLASLELVRGPGSALYGADAFNGVLNVVTKAPRFSQGGKVQATGGDLSTKRLDGRVAGEIGGGFFFKVTGGWMESDDFSVSRNAASGGPEYNPCPTAVAAFDCLNAEPVPLALGEDEIVFYGGRLDKYMGTSGHVLTFEAGNATVEGPVAQTGIGRVQLIDVERPWARANFNTHHWNVLGYWNRRDAPEQLALRSGANLVLDSENWVVEVQGNAGFAGGKGRVVGGASYKEEDIDSADPTGFQTLMFAPRNEDFSGVFGQAEYAFTDAVKAVVAARWDDSSLHDSQVSPRASLVWAVQPDHTLRFTYAEAFQTPNYSEFFLRAPVAPPTAALGALEAALAPFLGGVSLGFGSIPILAVGNEGLEPEEVTSYEVGYSAIFGREAYFTADYYFNDIENFVTDLITRIQPGIGNINPAFAPYAPPSQLPAPVQAIVLAQLAALRQNPALAILNFLTNGPNGEPLLVPVSYVNFGEVETQGFETGLNWYFADNWTFDASYSWLDFDVKEELAADPVVPNAPENKASLGLGYLADRWDASLRFRWVDEFDWAAGVFRGVVPSYEVVNLTANFKITPSVGVGVDVSNLLDDDHWEAFGGDIIERRALAHVNYSW